MRLLLATVVLALCAAACLAGPPAAVPWKDIPDPADSAQRHVVVRAADRGPVWLLTGILNNYTPEYGQDVLDALKIKHWRSGLWPFWYPSTITASPREKWGDYRDSATFYGEYLDAMNHMRKQGMTWQVLIHHQGPYYNQYAHPKESLKDYHDHIYTLVKYCAQMGAPVDYWEVDNEPHAGPFEGVQGNGFQGTWQEYLDYWDTAYDAIRAANPKAKIVGPSYGTVTTETMEPFLQHCKDKGQKVDVLSWHEITQNAANTVGDWIEPDKAQKNIVAIRTLVETRFPMLEVKEYHIDEWGGQISYTGPGTQMAMFYYLGLAGVDRAAKAHWTQNDLCGIMASSKVPRTSYWAWREYAAGTGVRLVTETNDRCVIAIASRDDAAETVRAVVARSKRYTGPDFAKMLPPARTVVDFEGVPITGKAEITILKLGPDDGPVWEDDLPALTTRKSVDVKSGKLSILFEALAENEVRSVRIAPQGTWAKEQIAQGKLEADRKAATDAAAGNPLPNLLFRDGFEAGYVDGESLFGKSGWTHAKNTASTVLSRKGATAHSGDWYGDFSGNYWSTHDLFRPIPSAQGKVIEATAWFRFSDFEGNKDGKGFAGMMLGLSELAERDSDRNYAIFDFGTNEQTGYAVAMFNDAGTRTVRQSSPSGIRHDVRGKWVQLGVVIDRTSNAFTARYRFDAEGPWSIYYTGKFPAMTWQPKFVSISAYNQQPDYAVAVDDIEVRSSNP